MDYTQRLENLSLEEKRRCNTCKEHKDISEYHVGSYKCKDCKSKYDMERKGVGPKVNTTELLNIIKEMASDIAKMKRALKRHEIELSDDENVDEKLKNSEKPKKNTEKKLKQTELVEPKSKSKSKSKSDVDTADDESEEEVVKKPKKKVGRPKKVDLDAVPTHVRELMEKKREKKERRGK